MFESDYRDLAYVPRWGIARTTRTQSVAEHSYYVTLYSAQILSLVSKMGGKNVGGIGRSNILTYALVHDRDEAFMSDIPGPVKRSIRDKVRYDKYVSAMEKKTFRGGTPSPGKVGRLVVKAADLMDEFAFWQEELDKGNKFADTIMPKIKERLVGACAQLENEMAVPGKWRGEIVTVFMEGLTKVKTIPENNDDLEA